MQNTFPLLDRRCPSKVSGVRRSDFPLQRLGRAAQRSALAVVGSEKHAVDCDAPLFELGLDVAVVVVQVIGQNVVLGIDGKAVDGEPLDIIQADPDQVPVFDLFGQAVEEGFFADDGEPAAGHGQHAVEVQHAFHKPDAFHRIVLAQDVFEPLVAGLVGPHAGVFRIADQDGSAQHENVAALQKGCVGAGGFEKLGVGHGEPPDCGVGAFFGQDIPESGDVHLADRRPQIEFDDVAADDGHVVPGEVLAEAVEQYIRAVVFLDEIDGDLRGTVDCDAQGLQDCDEGLVFLFQHLRFAFPRVGVDHLRPEHPRSLPGVFRFIIRQHFQRVGKPFRFQRGRHAVGQADDHFFQIAVFVIDGNGRFRCVCGPGGK